MHINGISDYTLLSESIPLMNKDDLGLIPAAERLKGSMTSSEIKDTGHRATHFASRNKFSGKLWDDFSGDFQEIDVREEAEKGES